MKRVLLVQDICIVGKTSCNLSIPLFSSMGIETFIAPVFSHISVYDDYELNSYDNSSSPSEMCGYVDLSYKLNDYAWYFKENKIHFDGILINGDFSLQQSEKIIDFLSLFLSNDCFLILAAYKNLSFYKKLYDRANIIISPVKELYNLFEKNENSNIYNKDLVENLFTKIKTLVKGTVIATDYFINDKKQSLILCEKNCENLKWFYHNKYGSFFYGLNDIFSSVIAGAVINRMELEKAIRLGIKVTEKSAENTLSKPDHSLYGADFESILNYLAAF